MPPADLDKPIGYTINNRPLDGNAGTMVALVLFHEEKLIAVRRNYYPGTGLIGLPGGFQMRETWQQAGCRELLEKTGFICDPDSLRQLGEVTTDTYGHNLIIATSDADLDQVRDFECPPEVSEVLMLDRAGISSDWVFSLHFLAAQAALSKTSFH